MASAAGESEPRNLLLARILIAIDGLLWLGLAGLAFTDHMLRHEFDCYAGCGIAGPNPPPTGFRGAINDPAVIACLLVTVVQWLLAWRMLRPRRTLTVVAAGFQAAVCLGVVVATFSHLSLNLAIDLSLLAGVPALLAAGLLLTPPVRRLWRLGDPGL
jgi:hypothetical protein